MLIVLRWHAFKGISSWWSVCTWSFLHALWKLVSSQKCWSGYIFFTQTLRDSVLALERSFKIKFLQQHWESLKRLVTSNRTDSFCINHSDQDWRGWEACHLNTWSTLRSVKRCSRLPLEWDSVNTNSANLWIKHRFDQCFSIMVSDLKF